MQQEAPVSMQMGVLPGEKFMMRGLSLAIDCQADKQQSFSLLVVGHYGRRIGGFEDETIRARFPKKPNNKKTLKTK